MLAVVGKSRAARVSFEPVESYARTVAVEDGANYEVRAGGLAETCLSLCGKVGDNSWRAVVCGAGIGRGGVVRRWMSEKEWVMVLQNPALIPGHLQRLDGHFIIARWNDVGEFDFFTDRFGLRPLFVASAGANVAISTRLDWVARFSGKCDIDFERFGPNWLAHNPFRSSSFVRGVEMTGPCAHLSVRDGKLKCSSRRWIPTPAQTEPESGLSVLQSFLDIEGLDQRERSLGLSGGLDSRVLLALLLRGDRPFSVHTFGDPRHPDAVIAQRIARKLKLRFRHIPPLDLSGPDAEQVVRQYAAETLAGTPIYQAFKAHYGQLAEERKVMVDGGFGEIGRRQFLNRLLRMGTVRANADPKALTPLFRFSRPDVFTAEINEQMCAGFERELEAVWAEMPDPDEIGRENFADLIAVRTRLPTFYALEQTRIDGQVLNFMPFAQPSYVEAALGLPLNHRNNSALYRRTVRKHGARLARFPLVKGNVTYPFRLSTVPTFAVVKLEQKLRLVYEDPLPGIVLDRMKDFALDILASSETRSFGAYDYRRLHQLVDGYYSGRHNRAVDVCWWLSFELWRQSIGAK